MGQSYLRYAVIPHNHAISSLLEYSYTQNPFFHKLVLPNLIPRQKLKLKSPIINVDHRLTQIYTTFKTSPKCITTPDLRVVNHFSPQFSFHTPDSKKENKKEIHLKNLNNVFSLSQSHSSHICIVADGGVKDRSATTIAYLWQNNTIMHKPRMHATNITSTETEIMSMRLGLDQALKTIGVKKITIITDAIHGTKKLFDVPCHQYQILIIPILKKIHKLFTKSLDNNIAIWHCPSSYKWKPHKDINKEAKLSRTTLILPSKES